ncbi:hypothetical protein F0562_021931 [Nyssa sinensis]|uniref:Uncharacterized protein n=1 Tax=Nyssa sinensis TaxID=561372 RepID=A0A5J5BQ95_9ASTE|nr:hypothetical protein F0562_021931 [Nyssa sinensis]
MAQQEEGWPPCLQPLNSRVGLVRNCNFAGSVNTLLNGSPSSSTDSSSSLDIEGIRARFRSWDLVCKFCHKFGPGHYQNECPCNPKRKHHFNPSRGNQSKSGPHFTSQSAVAATEDSQNSDVPTSSISVTDLEAIFKRVLAHSDSSTSTAFYVTQAQRLVLDEIMTSKLFLPRMSDGKIKLREFQSAENSGKRG